MGKAADRPLRTRHGWKESIRPLTAGIAVAAGLALAGIGLLPAYAGSGANSTSCSTTTPGAVPVSLGVDNGASGPVLCYSTTPTGSTAPEAAGGSITVFNPLATSSAGVECKADRGSDTVVALDCLNRVVHFDDPNHIGTSVSGTVGVGPVSVNVFRTGTENNAPITTVDAPADGNTVTSAAVDNHTCAWISGPGPCPLGITDAAVVVQEGDLPTATIGGAGTVCAGVFINGTCVGTTVTVPSSVNVTVGGDPNNTVDVDVAGTTQSANIPQTTVPIL